jgi:alpha-tubulin suppressor-like RCC1 family protein
VAAGKTFTLMTDSDGSVWATGSAKYGQIPGAGRQDLLAPVRVFSAPPASYQ